MITAVTAFIPIPDHPRSVDEYHALGEQLIAMDSKIPLLSATGEVEDCWLYGYICDNYTPQDEITHSVSDNPKKNTIEYHIVQAQKTAWLVEAAVLDPTADVFCWIDYGIFHVPGVTAKIIEEFLHRAADERTIAIPGCWEKGSFQYSDFHPCWRFCGGVMVVPRRYIIPLDMAMKHEYVRWLKETGNISWEVNTLARVEQLEPDLPFWWYKSNHDSSMFTNYRTTEYADERSSRLASHHEVDQRFI